MKSPDLMTCQQQLLTAVSEQLRLTSYVETGTFQGENLAWACARFDRIITIETNHALWQEAYKRFGQLPNLDLRLGNYAEELEQVVNEPQIPTLFRLDDHQDAETGFSGYRACRLLLILDAINRLTVTNVVAVDDIHLFLAPPAGVEAPEEWPTLYDVVERLAGRNHERHVQVVLGMAVAVPKELAPWLAQYSQKLSYQELEEKAWLEQTDPFVVGVEFLKKGIAQRLQRVRAAVAARRRLSALLGGQKPSVK